MLSRMTGGADPKKVTLQARLPRAMPVWLSQKQPLWEHSQDPQAHGLGSLSLNQWFQEQNYEKSNASKRAWAKVRLERRPPNSSSQ